MKGWKWILATAALIIGVTGGGVFAQEQRWGDRRDTDGASAQRYESKRNYNRKDSYRSRDGDRDAESECVFGLWR